MSDFSSYVSPRKTAKQERSRRKAQLILDTTLALLAEGVGDKINTKIIAASAKISVGNLYQFYPNKEAVYRDLYARWFEEVSSVLRHAKDELSGSAALEYRVDHLLEVLGKNQALNNQGYWRLRSEMERSPDLQGFAADVDQLFHALILEIIVENDAALAKQSFLEMQALQKQVTLACIYVLSFAGRRSKREELLQACKATMMTVFSF